MITTKQRAYLKKLSHDLEDVVIIGKNDIEDSVVKAAKEALDKRELIKCKILPSSMAGVRESAEYLAKETAGEVVFTIGNKFVLYKRKKKDPKIILPL